MHRHPSPRNRTFKRCGFTLISVVVLMLAAVAGPSGPAAADDPQRGYEAAQAELSRLGHESEILVDRFNTNAEKLTRLERQLVTARGRLDGLRREVAAQRIQVRRQAVIAYKFGSDQSVSLLMSLKDPGEFPAASKYLGHMQAGARVALDGYKAAQDDLDAEVATVQSAEREQKRTVDALRSQRSRIESGISRQEALASRYKTEIDAQRAREQAAAEARLRAAEAAARARPVAAQARPAPANTPPRGGSPGGGGGAGARRPAPRGRPPGGPPAAQPPARRRQPVRECGRGQEWRCSASLGRRLRGDLHGPGAARQAVPVGCCRPRRLRLLGAHVVRVAGRGQVPAPLVVCPDQFRAERLDGRHPARRPPVAPGPHCPLHRGRHGHPRFPDRPAREVRLCRRLFPRRPALIRAGPPHTTDRSRGGPAPGR